MIKFGCPIEIIFDQDVHFMNKVIHKLAEGHMIMHKVSTSYYPLANGHRESSNNILVKILRRIVAKNRLDWDKKLDSFLWAFCIAYKMTTRMTPFLLI